MHQLQHQPACLDDLIVLSRAQVASLGSNAQEGQAEAGEREPLPLLILLIWAG